MDPENGYIIDIGANIGDSSIYFALNNAKKVIALEPYPYSYNYALKNININNLNDKITLLNAGYGEDSEIKIDENKITYTATALISSNQGKEIKIYSLKTLITYQFPIFKEMYFSNMIKIAISKKQFSDFKDVKVYHWLQGINLQIFFNKKSSINQPLSILIPLRRPLEKGAIYAIKATEIIHEHNKDVKIISYGDYSGNIPDFMIVSIILCIYKGYLL